LYLCNRFGLFYIKMKTALKYIFFFVIVFITYPLYTPDFGIGLDDSYVWGLNWLFCNDYQTLLRLIYPIGPLGFLKMPTIEGYNFLIYNIFTISIKFFFVFFAFHLSKLFYKSTFIPLCAIFFASCYATTDILISFLCIILCTIFLKEKKNLPYYIIACCIASIGWYIKSSIGVACFSVIAVTLALSIYEYRSLKFFFATLSLFFATFLSVSLIIYNDLHLFLVSFLGTIKLVMGYGGAMSLHPDNNWWYLSVFFISIISFPFVVKEKYPRFVFLLALFPLFANWKHGIIREDIYHYKTFVVFCYVFWAVLLLSVSKNVRRYTSVALALISLCMITLNYSYFLKTERPNLANCGTRNFYSMVISYNSTMATADSLTTSAILACTLPNETLGEIGNSSIDFFPCDYVFAAQNKLNWQPRTTLGAAMSPSLKNEATRNYFADKSSVNFVFWKLQNDVTYDNRYFLSDEPCAVFNILNNYKIIEQNESFLLLKKSDNSSFSKKYVDKEFTARYNEWIDVPYFDDEVLRVKLFTKTTIIGSIKKALYKDEIYYIDYLTKDNNVYTYRLFLPSVCDGIWINPFFRHPSDGNQREKIKQIRFRNSCEKCIENKIMIQFEHLQLKNPQKLFKIQQFQQENLRVKSSL